MKPKLVADVRHEYQSVAVKKESAKPKELESWQIDKKAQETQDKVGLEFANKCVEKFKPKFNQAHYDYSSETETIIIGEPKEPVTDTDVGIKSKERSGKFICTKCGVEFEVEHEISESGALCNDCFSKMFKSVHGYEPIMHPQKQKPKELECKIKEILLDNGLPLSELEGELLSRALGTMNYQMKVSLGREPITSASDTNLLTTEDSKTINEIIIDKQISKIKDLLTQQRTELLKKQKTRLEILKGRMEACEEIHPDTHKVSLLEIPSWIEEITDLLKE